jgi:predicted aldo/keto reductase-like oxidoreductase
MKENNGIDRRHFLKKSALGVGAVGAGLLSGSSLLEAGTGETPAGGEIKVKEYRTLGRTGFKVSDVSTGYVKDAAVLEKLLDAGVNYIDTAESYGNEPVIGKVISKRDRKKLFISSKLEIKKDVSKEGFLKRARQCLERLQTDYLDCMMIHSCERPEILKTEGFHAAMKQLKTEGKLRFIGVSNHGSNWYRPPEESMEKVLMTAVQDGRFDVFLMAYNFIQDDNGARVLEACKEKNIGATLMKVNPIGSIDRVKAHVEKLKKEKKELPEMLKALIPRIEGKEKRAQWFIKKYQLNDAARMRDAAIRYVLSNPDVHTVCCAFRNFESVDAFLPLSGTKLSDMEKVKLAAYKEGCAEFYCRHACGICEPACPSRVPVNAIMRYNHYFDAQGKEKFAMKSYANLETAKADTCAQCSGHCEKACPYGVPVQGLLHFAHHNLTIS